MRRTGKLIDKIASADNLRLAYMKARRGKQTRPDVRRFAENLDEQLASLQRELMTGEVEWGGYHCFKVHDPKERMIHAPTFRARVAHHAIMNLCEPAFESYQIFDSYACRKGKGLDAALSRTLSFCRRGGWFLKLDVRKYFDTIDHAVLKRLIRRRFKDRTVIQLFDSVIDTYETAQGTGVPIGNLTSQFFANHYLGVLDHYLKENLRIRRYLRYMDDFVIWSSSRQTLKTLRGEVKKFLAEQLSLEVKTPCQNLCINGMTFLGYKLYPSGLRLAGRSRLRFKRKARRYQHFLESGYWDEQTAALHMEPLIAFIKRGASRSFRERTFTELSQPSGRRPEARTG